MSEVEGREETETEGTEEEPQQDARPKVTMPQARDISRSEFTPHALGSKNRSAPRKGTRKAAKRRQIIYSVAGAVVVLALIGAGIWWETRPAPSVKFKGAFGKAPSVSVPKAKPAVKQSVKELIHGSGPKISTNDFVVAHLVAYQWAAKPQKTHEPLLDTFKQNKPAANTASQLTGLPALDKEIVGRTPGTRLELTLPYKVVGDQVAQALKLGAGDDLVLSVDVLKAYGKTASVQGTQQKIDAQFPQVTPGAPGQAPTVKIPSGSAPKKLEVQTLIEGTGKAVAKGQTLVGQYDGVLWRTGKEFDSSYKHGAPAGFPIGVGQVIPGWDKALVGKKIGSRVLVIVPPKEGYGSTGSPQAGIKGTDTLVFVVDILDAI
ncbi:FKBP-type peptidyl-prolyl cis-trans isomerase [Actinoallomurus sp. CA-142502]|uniref:FKBP-type peptidyl-prolyl cis-trans isomerase n=1 Tax=Actinoallomurus sp. CA-142502 TaxID=3239885 RepID=UPI003D90EDB5